MAYLPPVVLPDLANHDYARDLYAMTAGVGNAWYGAKRDKIGDAQWQQEQDRLSAAQALAQSNADRNYALELQKFQAGMAGGGEDEWYGSPQWFQGSDGKMGFGVLSKSGQFREMAPPEGSEWAPTVTFQDTGTARVPMYTRGGGQAGAPLPKDVSGENTAQETGTARGKAQAALPGIQHNIERAVMGIDDLLADPDLLSVIGPIEGRLPAVSWSGAREDAQAKIDYVVGQVFQQAYDAIRGAGPISQYETMAASDAYARVKNQRVGDADYIEALNDFRNELLKLGQLAEQKAAMEGTATTQPANNQPLIAPSGNSIRQVGP